MQKRNEAKKEVKMLFRTKLKRTAVVAFCLFFAYSAIYAVDISTKRMLKKENENRYAMRVSMENDNMLRVDLAGTNHYVDVGDIKIYLNNFTDKAKDFMVQLKVESENYMRSVKKGRDK